jgi:uncharacterized protein (DUF4213/DUF364 family)
MLKTGTILADLYQLIRHAAKKRKVIDLRIGLGYIGVSLDTGNTGIAAVLFDALPQGCTVMPPAGSFAGSPAADLLKYLITGKNPLETAIGLATANAFIEPPQDNIDDREATTYLDLQKGVKVAMVGFFAPLIARIQARGASLTVIEKNPARTEILNDAGKKQALKSCDVAIITATTLLNNTFEETINSLGTPCSVILMGPSTPLLLAIFRSTPVTHLGGALVTNPGRVLQIISEGGGTPALRPHLRFVNLIRK